jgi:hypothetical protein
VQTSDGGYMVGGYDNDSPFLGLALKLGSNDQVQWAKTSLPSGCQEFNGGLCPYW